MKQLILGICLVLVCLALCASCQKSANAASGDKVYSVIFPEFSTATMGKPLRPCKTGTAAIKVGTNNTKLYICMSTVAKGRKWHTTTFAAMSGK